jgi:hypothetical protein
MKPELPREIQFLFPMEVVARIRSFTPHLIVKNVSPSLQRELKKIQMSPLKGKKETYLIEFEDFVLD